MESNKYIPETFFFVIAFFSAVVVICRHNFYLLFSLKISDLHLWGNKKYGKTISSHFRSLGLWERGKYRFSSTGLASKSTSSVKFFFFFSDSLKSSVYLQFPWFAGMEPPQNPSLQYGGIISISIFSWWKSTMRCSGSRQHVSHSRSLTLLVRSVGFLIPRAHK